VPEHAAPENAGVAGLRLWTSVTSEFELEEHELAVLREACKVADTCNALQAILDDESLMIGGGMLAKANPAMVELRLQRIVLARLLASLRIPLSDSHEAERPQRRVGVKGVYPKRAKVPPGLKVVTP
jgi:hypothetical protein